MFLEHARPPTKALAAGVDNYGERGAQCYGEHTEPHEPEPRCSAPACWAPGVVFHAEGIWASCGGYCGAAEQQWRMRWWSS